MADALPGKLETHGTPGQRRWRRMIQTKLHQGTRLASAPEGGATYFRVWLTIESFDGVTHEYDSGHPQPLGYFGTDEAAEAFVERLARLINPDEQEQTR